MLYLAFINYLLDARHYSKLCRFYVFNSKDNTMKLFHVYTHFSNNKKVQKIINMCGRAGI